MSGRLFDPISDQSLQPRTIVPQMDMRAGTAAGAAATEFFGVAADAALRMAEAQRRAERADAEARTRMQMTVGLAELRQSLNEGDPATIKERWQAGVTALRDRVTGELPERQRGQAARLAEQLVAGAHDGMLETHARRTGDAARANLLNGIGNMVRMAVQADDPRERMGVVQQIDAAIAAQVEAGVITAEAAERIRMNTRARIDRGRASHEVSRQRGRGPAAVRDMPGLSPALRAELEAQAAREAVEAAQEQEAEEQQVVSQHRATVDERASAALLGAPGAPAAQEVIALRHDLAPERYAAVMTVASGQAARQDAQGDVDDLTAGAGLDAEGSYRSRLDRALASGRITRETHARLTDLDLSLRSHDPVAQARRQERDAIVQSMIDVERIDPSLTGITTRALDAWEAWHASNEAATPQQRREALDWLRQTAMRDTVREAMRVLPRPGMVQMRPGQPPKLADLDKTEAELLDALDAIEVGDDAGDAAVSSAIVDELALIERWRIVAGMAEEAAAAEPRQGSAR